MEEKVQEMLKIINNLYEDFEVIIVDLSLVQKLENLANEVAIRSLLRKLYFKYFFLFFVNEGLFIVSELYMNINKDKEKIEYEVGRIYEPIPNFPPKHELYFMIDLNRCSTTNDEIDLLKRVFQKVLKEEGLYRYYMVHNNYLVIPLEAKVLDYSFL